ncbi:uncharacterized protein N7515_009579 [Penicillium bovifimosum]|uniref:Uncharacterized protein n=1 Tax=Penicillium bovifimosum TaxID=126998 RepID=A0A9W9GJK2_9EURO|nr:uncharacterized protein N7515_009579 [Penicillium bovifimosum]KAJ5121618.1 hypothetical protein N7515_009579 [Penicillium bovifimosum]
MAVAEQDSYDLDPDGAFLKDLPPLLKRYTFQGKEQFHDILETETARFEASADTSEFLLFHANKETIETLFDPLNEDTDITKFCSSFDSNERLFLVSMPLGPHNTATDEMNFLIRKALRPMDLDSALREYPGITVQGESRGKVPDYGWGPKRRARGPSVTLEIAFSESDSKLDSDVRFWLNPDDGNADICLTLRINKSRPEIRVEKWELQNNRIHRAQAIWMTKERNHAKAKVIVTGHPLIIPFDALFHRQPVEEKEKDLEIPEQQLGALAASIWEEQGLFLGSTEVPDVDTH